MDGSGEVIQILLGRVQGVLDIGLKSALAREFEIGSNVGENGTGSFRRS
jgi:hypothetical protein